MSNQNPIFSFAASQNITPSPPDSLYNQTTSAEDLATLFNTNIPEELPQIDEEKAKKLQIDDDYVHSLSAVLANLVSTIPDFPQPQFIPLKHLHDDINVRAEIDKMMKKKAPPAETSQPPSSSSSSPPLTTTPQQQQQQQQLHFPHPPPSNPHLLYPPPQPYSYCAYPYPYYPAANVTANAQPHYPPSL